MTFGQHEQGKERELSGRCAELAAQLEELQAAMEAQQSAAAAAQEATGPGNNQARVPAFPSLWFSLGSRLADWLPFNPTGGRCRR